VANPSMHQAQPANDDIFRCDLMHPPPP
jgi:hypothetical protein